MTQALQQQELLAANRAIWIDALMKEGYRQCTGQYRGNVRVKGPLPVLNLDDPEAFAEYETYREVCALGLADEVIGRFALLFGSDQDVTFAAARITHDNDKVRLNFDQIAQRAINGKYW